MFCSQSLNTNIQNSNVSLFFLLFSFKQKQIETDKLGMTHVRLQQTKNGVPVEGAEVTDHYSKANPRST
ncbi:hypothetical protein [Fictibacillus sp. S7]|uniref:hypothetical protein n=1 Tax=Fictibacillus sp. S7 TaxID=2212476 RepID=UPI0010118B3C|nr:hypothetical protein [Fictibacillus sp. S7]RXY98863.1 hypothetical protein DMO16_03770 [Fictibacillus sp. S7]